LRGLERRVRVLERREKEETADEKERRRVRAL